ncbi:hypothetical protein WPS_17470 [Vulcanimicrobium alpinum]|uniref:Uncharacterized protein n=2 Tax=Vulcanimicrobium alpinum TaxID=3016050 RepID=A0AAN1XXL2_UNVUL|nr:hypothetical protein WPS_17470 [Vulcanimicrobium alpinum]
MPALSAWSNFYVVTGSSAAALTGLMFVVITLVVANRSTATREGIATFSTPTVAHFSAALLVSAIMSAPWRALSHVAAVVGIVGAVGLTYSAMIAYRARRQTAYDPDLEDLVWYVVMPLIAYLVIGGAALGLARYPAVAPFVLAAGSVLLIFLGIHNAWDVVTYLAIEKVEPPDDAAPPSGA